jgi:2-polyprenyl-3-methyl-5-hydroxy-6-metoxy-1,4-benzoquinol methylase
MGTNEETVDAVVSTAEAWAHERDAGERFEFGENWSRFLEVLDDARIAEAENSLKVSLGVDNLSGMRFFDIGSGSGLFSLAAARLGAQQVHSLDFDPASVRSTQELRHRYFPGASHWTVEKASVLDGAHIRSLGGWDVVYSWGVLHHTGDMHTAMNNAADAVAPGGKLFISIYNDQGRRSRIWRAIKRVYNALPPGLRSVYVVLVMLPHELRAITRSILVFDPMRYVRSWTEYKHSRGMSRWHDLVDWVGGYPFEVASPEDVFEFFDRRGFNLTKLVTVGGDYGCNEFVFTKSVEKLATGSKPGPRGAQ